MCYPKYKFNKISNNEIVNRIKTLKETCVLDIANENGATLERIGQITGFTREYIRQIEYAALQNIKHPSRYIHIETFKNQMDTIPCQYFEGMENVEFMPSPVSSEKNNPQNYYIKSIL